MFVNVCVCVCSVFTTASSVVASAMSFSGAPLLELPEADGVYSAALISCMEAYEVNHQNKRVIARATCTQQGTYLKTINAGSKPQQVSKHLFILEQIFSDKNESFSSRTWPLNLLGHLSRHTNRQIE